MVLKGTLQLLTQLKDKIREKELRERLEAKRKERAPKRRESRESKESIKQGHPEPPRKSDGSEPSDLEESNPVNHHIESNTQRVAWSIFYVGYDLSHFEELLVDLRESYTAVRTQSPSISFPADP
jgi:hypothetical protein